MNHLGFVAVMAIFKIVKVMAIAVMPIELVIYISRRAKRKGCPKTAREKRIEFQHMEERQKRLWKLLERSCFAVFGIVWTATGTLAAVYGLGPYALLAFLPAAGFWAMLFSGYTAPFYYFTVICLRRQLYSRTAILIIHCPRWENVVYYGHGKTIGPKAALPLLFTRRVQIALQTKERRAMQ